MEQHRGQMNTVGPVFLLARIKFYQVHAQVIF